MMLVCSIGSVVGSEEFSDEEEESAGEISAVSSSIKPGQLLSVCIPQYVGITHTCTSRHAASFISFRSATLLCPAPNRRGH